MITASTVIQRGATSAPILRLSAVNMTSGTMAKGSCKAQHHLAEDQKLGRSRLAVPDGDDRRRHDGDAAGHQAAAPKAAGGCRESPP